MICEVCFENPAKYWLAKYDDDEMDMLHQKDLCQECKDRLLDEIQAAGEMAKYDFETLY